MFVHGPTCRLLLAFATLCIAGCANPLNRVTHDRYLEDGQVAERNGNLNAAEVTYYRALVNDHIGDLGDLLIAQDEYNLGRIKRHLHKFGEAEELLRNSLILDEKILKPDNLDTDRCRVELSVTLAAQNKWEEGSHFLEPVLPDASRFTGNEREYLSEACRVFAAGLRQIGLEDRAKIFDL